MREVTHISYGHGRVDIVLDSDSQTSVAAPGFRFGDYATLVTSCFSQKELQTIGEGELAQITFYFVVSDEIDEQELFAQYGDAILVNEGKVGDLHEGIQIDISASKSIADSEPEEFSVISKDVELQMDIPLFLVKEDRYYFFLNDKSGNYAFLEDSTPEADVLTVKTHVFTPGVLLYQDSIESLMPREDTSFKIEMRYVLFAGVVLLAGLWIFIDRLHRKS